MPQQRNNDITPSMSEGPLPSTCKGQSYSGNVANEEMAEKLSIRKQRFLKFASLEYEGEYYMTPRDFLFSVMFDQVGRKLISPQ
uniref:Uncharacterized protein n=1 Tax=Chelonoidis abingdonii TaxID=106734 RepID=A0A8C0G2R3_CHEAB